MRGDTVYCRDCGSEIAARAEICPECGIRQQSPESDDSGTDAGIAAAASFVIPGLGQVVNGELAKGIILGIVTVTFALTGAGLILAIPLWLWLVYDAYRTADATDDTVADSRISVNEVNAAVHEALTWYAGRGGDADRIDRLKERYRSVDSVSELDDDDLKTLLEAIESYETYHDSTDALQRARSAFMAERD